MVVHKLEYWADEKSLEINQNKTVHMAFRKGGKTVSDDTLLLLGELLEKIKNFRDL